MLSKIFQHKYPCAQAEAWALMNVVQNLCTPKSGSPLVSACQDFLTASFLLTQRDSFLTREEFCSLCVFMCDGRENIQLPEPAILVPVRLWTGKSIGFCQIRTAA